jgi:hypothetical protein
MVVFLPLVSKYLTTVPLEKCGFGLRLAKATYAVNNTTTFGGHQGVPKVSCQQVKALDVCGAQLQVERPQCLHTFVEVGLRLFLNLKCQCFSKFSVTPCSSSSLTRSPQGSESTTGSDDHPPTAQHTGHFFNGLVLHSGSTRSGEPTEPEKMLALGGLTSEPLRVVLPPWQFPIILAWLQVPGTVCRGWHWGDAPVCHGGGSAGQVSVEII